MTLVLSAISPRWAMQASDRRVVAVNRAEKIVARRDERNKAIFVAERMTFAYAGHADIGGLDTAEWFQQRLATRMSDGGTIEEALAEVAEMLTQYFRSLPADVDDRRHAFAGVGWTVAEVSQRSPFLVTMSNSLTSGGEWLPTPRSDFAIQQETLDPGEPCRLSAAGIPLSEEMRGHIRARIASQLDDGDDPTGVARILIETIREVAAVNEAVGPGVMVNCLPVAPGPPDGNVMLVGGLPERDVRTFTYVSSGGFDGRYLGPLVVTSDGSQLANFEASGAEVTPDGGTTGFMYRPSTAPPLPKAAVGQRVREYRIGRNEPCWCGSGKKYKRCHGA